MFITELFNDPVKISDRRIGPDEYRSTFYVGDVRYSFAANQFGPNDLWDIEFIAHSDRGSSAKITGTGNEITVFSTVVSIMKEFMDLYHPVQLHFTADEPSRKKLYHRLIDKLLKNWIKSFDPEYGIFLLTNPNADTRTV